MADTDTVLYFRSQANDYVLIIPLHQVVAILDEIYNDILNSSHALSEETIMEHLKTRTYAASTKRVDEEPDICVICQGEYETNELIGGLQCRHEYHVECIKKWLQQNNSCPICKATAVSQSVDKS